GGVGGGAAPLGEVGGPPLPGAAVDRPRPRQEVGRERDRLSTVEVGVGEVAAARTHDRAAVHVAAEVAVDGVGRDVELLPLLEDRRLRADRYRHRLFAAPADLAGAPGVGGALRAV